jgi:UDP-sugar transporter A1/2/3
MLLYAWGVLFTVAAHVLSTPEANAAGDFFSGFDHRTYLIIAINAFTGQVVSRVLKYADNITKVFAGAVGVVVTTLVSAQFFNYSVSLLFSLGTGVVILASGLFLASTEWLVQKY